MTLYCELISGVICRRQRCKIFRKWQLLNNATNDSKSRKVNCWNSEVLLAATTDDDIGSSRSNAHGETSDYAQRLSQISEISDFFWQLKKIIDKLVAIGAKTCARFEFSLDYRPKYSLN